MEILGSRIVFRFRKYVSVSSINITASFSDTLSGKHTYIVMQSALIIHT